VTPARTVARKVGTKKEEIKLRWVSGKRLERPGCRGYERRPIQVYSGDQVPRGGRAGGKGRRPTSSSWTAGEGRGESSA
jgi:hypothetical protein